MAFTPLVAMIRKDLQLFFTDRRSVIVSFAVPILIATFFGSVFRDASSGRNRTRVAIAVVDQDGSGLSKRIVSGLSADPNLVVTTPLEADARQAVKAGRIPVGVILPAGFGTSAVRSLASGARPALTLVYDPSRGVELAMIRGVLTQHVMQAALREMLGGAAGQRALSEAVPRIEQSDMPEDQKQALIRFLRSAGSAGADGSQALTLSLPYEVHEEAMTGDSAAYNGYAHSFGGMGVQFLLFAMANLGVDMLLERQRGLWRRLRSAPVSRITLLAGKAASGAIISFLILAVCFAFAMIVFKVRIEGSLVGFLGVALACSLMASTFGLLVAALGNSPATARGVTTLAVLMMVMLGGAWVPTFIFPAWLQRLTVIVPARWAVDGLDAATWRGAPLSGVLMPIAVLVAFACAFSAIAAARFRWEET